MTFTATREQPPHPRTAWRTARSWRPCRTRTQPLRGGIDERTNQYMQPEASQRQPLAESIP